MDAINNNGLSQAYALRRYYLPHEKDDEISLARALWLHKNHFECLADSVAVGISKVL